MKSPQESKGELSPEELEGILKEQAIELTPIFESEVKRRFETRFEKWTKID